MSFKTKLICLSFFSFAMIAKAQKITGELKTWHKVTLTFNGPNTSETAIPNPFSDYKLDVTFTKGKTSYTVPGYYAACDNPAEGCTSGNKWKVHFAPDSKGTWSYKVAFKTGKDVAVSNETNQQSAGFMDNTTGSFKVKSSDKSGRDFRAPNHGRLQYVGERYLRFSGTNPKKPNGKWFVKAGADSPENTFAYDDFDATPNRRFSRWNNKKGILASYKRTRKSWNAHQQDYNAKESAKYTWQNGKGTELLGVVNYLSSQGANAMSFLTFNAGGDDQNVFPHLMNISIEDYENLPNGKDKKMNYQERKTMWDHLQKDRFDVSKLGQWEKILEYADSKGLYLHFKTMENENCKFMDNNQNGRERKLYYRELIARFSHHLALNWNITEETVIPDNVVVSISKYINSIDPYHHNLVLHTFPGQQQQKYPQLLGNKSELTGASIQKDRHLIHKSVKTWIKESEEAGKKWVVANDEQGTAGQGIRIPLETTRHEVLWATLMAGGAGVEYYYGYTDNDGDIHNQDHRLRGDLYKEGSYAIHFFDNYFQKYMIDAVSNDELTEAKNDYVLANNGKAYAVYLPKGGSTKIELTTKKWKIQWYNPRNGEMLKKSKLSKNLVIKAPDNQNDWVALITK
ncbi:hypothetical protein FHR24_002748 [Wenyingzhuangia heitensis]|uniref:Collagen-binding domain of a collagenase n=1 Tax=Wenyingzhuangia heitensis TaxID=1487859 RepID=A0ABX0UBQ7_9FLAO|nr:DUF5060 domain-containing protein [Wenyingzhuangia heitensis]NIJ46264.1 hypothetical protein [Wenyingzhuangia heitensis]